METCDSLDIQRLQAFALGYDDDDQTQMRATSALRHSNTEKASPSRWTPSSQTSISKRRRNKSVAPSPSQGHRQRIRQDQDVKTRPAASQIGLPGTIPDSSKGKMSYNSNPSSGDTQPVSQWVYEELARENESGAALNIEQDETGHVDLLNGFEQESGNAHRDSLLTREPEDDEADPLSQDVRAEIFPESQRFRQPKTPLTHGTKRKRRTPGGSAEVYTPELPVNPFANMLGTDEIMRPSQLFNATQALTSPNLVHSDGTYQRPSPHTNQVPRLATSLSVSSPLRPPRSSMSHTVAEPHTKWEPLAESQERRKKLEQLMRQVHAVDEDSDDEFSVPYVEPEHRLDRVDARTLRSRLSEKRSPIRVGSYLKNSTHNTRAGHSPMRSGKHIEEAVLISDDLPAGEIEANGSEDETEREEDNEKDIDEDLDELAEENKENVEVPMTVSRLHHRAPQIISSQPTPSRAKVHRLASPVRPSTATQVKGSPRLNGSSGNAAVSERGSQPHAIRDSQSSQHRNNVRRNVANSNGQVAGPSSSLDSRNVVLQSQLSQLSKSPVVSSAGMMRKDSSEEVFDLPPSSPPQLILSQHGDHQKIDMGRDKGLARSTAKRVSPVTRTTREHQESSIASGSTHLATVNDNNNVELSGGKTITPSAKDTTDLQTTRESTHQDATVHSTNGRSVGTTLFDTAPEQMSNTPSRSANQLPQPSSSSDQPSGSLQFHRRTLGEIIADPSPPDPLGDIDIDINLLSNEDIEFARVLRDSGAINSLMSGGGDRRNKSYKPIEDAAKHPWVSTPASSAISTLSPNPRAGEMMPHSSSPPQEPLEKQVDARNASDIQNLSRTDQPHQISGNDQDKRAPVETRVEASAKTEDEPPVERNPQLSTTTPIRTRTQEVGAEESNQLTESSPSSTTSRTSRPANHEEPLRPQEASAENPSTTVPVAPNRVFAHFNGRPFAYYPATCLGVVAGPEPRYTVRFDEGESDTVNAYGVKRLELMPGDVIKIISDRPRNYVVIKMQDQQDLGRPQTPVPHDVAFASPPMVYPEVDIHGFAKVLVAPKQRQSTGVEVGGEPIAVPLSQIYLTPSMWPAFKNRGYTHPQPQPRALKELQTPSERPSTPTTPSSRGQRAKSSLASSSRLPAETGASLFKNMAFTLTNIYLPADLSRTKTLIVSNGGRILEDGFDDLFHVPILHRTTSPKKSDADSCFHPTRLALQLGFTCLIADRHCRRAKYIQALALGIPCLATRWVADCISQQRVLPWSAYLLPSGESSFLGGAIHSRVLPLFTPKTATLTSIIENRPRMLEGASVLLIMNRSEQDTMKQHPLLTFALRPARVARAMSIEGAIRAVEEAQAVGEPWDWIFSYDREKEVERALFGSSRNKRKGLKGSGYSGDQGEGGRKTRVVGNEFVIQSLILGQLVGC